MIDMYINRMFHGVPVTWPCPEMPEGAKACYFPIHFSNKNRKPIIDPVIKPRHAHIQRMRLFTVNRGSVNNGVIINFQDPRQVIYRSITNNRRLVSHRIKIQLRTKKENAPQKERL